MQVRFLLGPAGSGKTRQCIDEVQACLRNAPAGPELLFIAPKQATFQIERQVLRADVGGFTRLQILSFERLARHIFDRFALPSPALLSEQGRVMVLGAILRTGREHLITLKTSGSVHRLAHEVSEQIREFQKQGISPDRLKQIAQEMNSETRLGRKLSDLASIFESYVRWLEANELKDFESLLDSAADLLEKSDRSLFESIWLDGFAQMTPQELRLLCALSRGACQTMLAFCCESEKEQAWFSHWAGITQVVRRCRDLFVNQTNASFLTERLQRSGQGRFASSPDLGHLEEHWDTGAPYLAIPKNLELVECASAEMEAVYAARQILQFVREEGRYKDVAVLLRNLESHHEVIRRVFERYGIPMFLDRRQSVSQHPLIELTRSALRVVCDGWQHDDWFALLKSGLVPVPAEEIHWLENAALEKGWNGEMWQSRLPFEESESARVESLRERLVRPVNSLAKSLARDITGSRLADSLQAFWAELGVSDRLEQWQSEHPEGPDIHRSVWTQIEEWINDIRLAFPKQQLPLAEWIPLLEQGLSELTVGMVPPALDQVLVGAVDRSRNPDLKLVICMGFNEGLFPGIPKATGLLNESERRLLVQKGFTLGGHLRDALSLEQFYGYIACTRAREKLIVTFSETDAKGNGLHPSIFVQKLRRLFPELQTISFSHQDIEKEWRHVCELIPKLLPNHNVQSSELFQQPLFAGLIDTLHSCRVQPVPNQLPGDLAARLYGNELHTSVSKFEDFPACAFKFFVRSGLRADERKTFELDSRQQGLFQHTLLELFHKQLQQENKRWRDVPPEEARLRIRKIAKEMIPGFGGGIMVARPENEFLAKVYTRLIEDFVVQIIAWMDQQWLFDPAEVEIGFGAEDELGRWPILLSEGKSLTFHGRIDRIDLWRDPVTGTTRYVVIDYKSGGKKLNRKLFERGMLQQLPAYMLAIQGSEKAREILKATKLEPAGAFFVSLRPELGKGENRDEVLDETKAEESKSYKHMGLFDFSVIDQLDAPRRCDQIGYRVTSDRNKIHGGSFGAKEAVDFKQTLEQNEQQLRQMAERVFRGEIVVQPYKMGAQVACKRCEFAGVCRFDPWRDSYNVIK
ncbi:MAG: ATP-dependent deoxyribonuclease subunit [Verrucomicrobiales bacterium]|nr:ATP-dependent deoxyribonuclease subunit [Verrucomicrobiales bacterium]